MPQHSPLPPFAATRGPRNASLALVGEAWGESESIARKPFAGQSGMELFRILGEAMPEIEPALHSSALAMMKYELAWVKKGDEWLEAAGIFMTNTLALRPPGNKVTELCVNKKEAQGLAPGYALPAIEPPGNYLRPEYLGELTRLQEELKSVRPNLTVALGAKASWALLGATNIGSIRGTVAAAPHGKVLPTYHPAAVLRQWSWRSILMADMMKAARERKFREIVRPERTILVNPTLAECQTYVARLMASPPALLGCDTETTKGQIKMVSFAPSRGDAIVIPFVKENNRSYWATPNEELAAWDCVAALLESPVIPKVFQNGAYDFQYLMPLGIRLANCTEDSMLLHHSLLPEMKKGLGFLGSIYTNEASWKLMRLAKPDTEKKDE